MLFSGLASASSLINEQIDSLKVIAMHQSGAQQIDTHLKIVDHYTSINENDSAIALANRTLEQATQLNSTDLRFRSYISMIGAYRKKNELKTARAYIDSAELLSYELDNDALKSELYRFKGEVLHNMSEELQALEAFNEAILRGRISNNFRTVAASYSMMANIYRVNGLYDRAIEFTIKANLNYEKAEYPEGAAWTSYMLGRIYFDLKLNDKARGYFNNAVEIYKKEAKLTGNDEGVAICYEQLGQIDMEEGKLDDAWDKINYVLWVFTETQSQFGVSNAYKNLGKIEYYRGNFVKAKSYLNESLYLKSEFGDRLSQTTNYEYLGLCELALGNTKSGFDYLQQSLEKAKANNQMKIQIEIYSQLARAYNEQNRPDKAIEAQEQQIIIQNKMLSGGATVKMDQLQAILEVEAQNIQIAELTNLNEISTLKLRHQKMYQTSLIVGIFLILVITLIISIFYWKIRQKNRELNEAITTKDKLFSIISHDLKGPVGSALGLSEYMLEEVREKNLEEVERYIPVFHQSLSDTFNLLTNLLDWSRSQLQHMDLSPQSINLYEIVEDIRYIFDALLQKKTLSMQLTIAPSIYVWADKDMLKTILRNLISNAIKFSSENTTITVSAEVYEERAEIRVHDEGIGIDRDRLKRLFHVDTQESTPGTSGEKGTGLGLTLVKEFVELNGGEIKVDSELNKGTCFIFSLPLDKDHKD